GALNVSGHTCINPENTGFLAIALIIYIQISARFRARISKVDTFLRLYAVIVKRYQGTIHRPDLAIYPERSSICLPKKKR
ncbi:MAG: hypothetical protein K6G30_05735, partial [Acetatifactor sp.]|nr:hypothetical protein [Acetatifactor sp.]